MSRQERLQQRLSAELAPLYLQIDNESSQHRVPEHAETHFKIMVVSDQFTPLTRLDRQRLVHEILAAELRSGLHALTLRLLSPAEWQTKQGQTPLSPPCHR